MSGFRAIVRAFPCILAACALVVRPALADKRTEAIAKEALRKAENDYLSMDYAKGAARLDRAVRACAANRCTRATRAALMRDLGTMQFRKGDGASASKSWAEALQLQPDLDINPSYDSPELRAAWDDAKGGGERRSASFAHTPALEQKAHTPLPVFFDHSGEARISRLVLKYRNDQSNDWSEIELQPMAGGWGGLIPCASVTPGTIRYWAQAFDDGGAPYATSGDSKHPYAVPVRNEISAEPPHLPGRSAPRTCEEPESAEKLGPTADHEERTTETAVATPTPRFARIWVGVSGAIDVVLLPSATDVCKLSAKAGPINSPGYYCTNPTDGSDFPSRATPDQNNQLRGDAGHVDGGFHIGNVRVMLAADYAVTANILAGARLGYVLDAYPGTAAVQAGRALRPKIHVEVRGTYVFGNHPLSQEGFAPMAFAGAGVSQFDAHITSAVTLDNVVGQQPVDVWLTNAPVFVVLGGGVRYQFSPRVAFTAAARWNLVFGGNGVLLTYGPELGVAYGF
jgi:hypothetical protein